MGEINKFKAPLRAPFGVCLWVSDSCNLNCKYCYAKPFSGHLMDSDRLLELIDELIACKVFDITLAGGEPLLHPKIFEVINKATSGGIRVGLLTNGVSLDKTKIAYLERTTIKENLIIQVSLDSLDESINDYSRGKSKVVINNLERLRKSSLEVQLACVVHSKNRKTAHEIIDHFYPDIHRFHFLNVQRTESSLIHDDLLLTEEEASEFWLNLNEHKKKFPEDLFLPSLRIQMRAKGVAELDSNHSLHQEATLDCSSCVAALTHINIDANFNVLGCDIAKDYTFMGNVAKRTFLDVWNSKEADEIRKSKYPPCYKIKDFDNKSLEIHLKPEYI